MTLGVTKEQKHAVCLMQAVAISNIIEDKNLITRDQILEKMSKDLLALLSGLLNEEAEGHQMCADILGTIKRESPETARYLQDRILDIKLDIERKRHSG